MNIHRTGLYVARRKSRIRHLVDTSAIDNRTACGRNELRMKMIYPGPVGMHRDDSTDAWILSFATCSDCVAAYAKSKLFEDAA